MTSNIPAINEVYADLERVLAKLQAAATDRPEAQKFYGIQARNLAKMAAAGVRLVLGSDQLKIICTNSEQEEAEEELEIDYKGDPLDIGFNITYLLDALQNVSVDKVRFAFGDANSSALVTMPDRDDYKYVVMPMRI